MALAREDMILLRSDVLDFCLGGGEGAYKTLGRRHTFLLSDCTRDYTPSKETPDS
jgi:hypothetical protein